MNLIIPIEKFDKKNIVYSDDMENKFLFNSKFVKVIYSTPIFTLQSLIVSFQLKDYYLEDFFDKQKCFFNKSKNKEIIEKMINIEYEILNYYNEFHNLKLNLKKLLDNSYFKLSNNNKKSKMFLLRISGIWFQNNECGLIFKFFIV